MTLGEKESSGSDDDEEDNEEEDEEDGGEDQSKDEKVVNESTDVGKTDEAKLESGKAEEGGSSQASETKEGKAKLEEVEIKSGTQDGSADVEMKESASTNDEATLSKAEDEPNDTAKPKSESKGKALKPVSATSEAKAENGDDGEDIAEDVSNLQLAWEMFELSKKIYQRYYHSSFVKFSFHNT